MVFETAAVTAAVVEVAVELAVAYVVGEAVEVAAVVWFGFGAEETFQMIPICVVDLVVEVVVLAHFEVVVIVAATLEVQADEILTEIVFESIVACQI